MFETKIVSLNELVLDPQNPRFTTRENKNFTQTEIIEYLIEYEELLDLTKKINEYGGFTPGERIIAVRKDDKYIVLEGNRRVSSLKILHDPKLASNKRVVIPKISKDCSEFINNIPIDVVASREEADRALLTRHIEGIRLWSTFSKMKFYRRMVDNGRSIDEISQMSMESSVKIKRTLHKYSILLNILEHYNTYFPTSEYLEHTIDTKLDTDLILNRMYTYFINELKLTFSEDTQELILPNNVQQKDLLTNILVTLAKMQWEEKVINTRILNKQKHIFNFFNGNDISQGNPSPINDTHKTLIDLVATYKGLIEEITGDKEPEDTTTTGDKEPKDTTSTRDKEPEDTTSTGDKEPEDTSTGDKEPEDTTTTGDKEPEDTTSTRDKEPEDKGNRTGRPRKEPKDYDHLLSAIPFKNKFTKNNRINSTISELKKIEYKNFGLSTNFLLRSLLESYAFEYTKLFSQIGQHNPNRLKGLTINNFSDKELHQKYFDFIAEHIGFVDNGIYISIKNHILIFFDKNNKISLTQKLNHYIHSPDFKPSSDENLHNWEVIKVILEVMDELLVKHSGQGN